MFSTSKILDTFVTTFLGHKILIQETKVSTVSLRYVLVSQLPASDSTSAEHISQSGGFSYWKKHPQTLKKRITGYGLHYWCNSIDYTRFMP